MKTNKQICAICGRYEEDHHDFEPSMPEGCQCDPGEWGSMVPDPCAEFHGKEGQHCSRCEHDAHCHRSVRLTP